MEKTIEWLIGADIDKRPGIKLPITYLDVYNFTVTSAGAYVYTMKFNSWTT